MNPSTEVRSLRQQLAAGGTAERAEHDRQYLKCELTFLGAPVPVVRNVAKAWLRAHRTLTREELLSLVDGLWAEGIYDLRLLAVVLLGERTELLQAEDAAILERLLRTSGTWALVDDLSVNTLGALVERFPSVRGQLPRWAVDEDFWIRRAALLSLLIPLRRGEGDFDLFARLAAPMLEDSEFFIRKAIGWILRESAKKRPERTAGFLGQHLDRVSGLTLREAARALPEEDRERLLASGQVKRAKKLSRMR